MEKSGQEVASTRARWSFFDAPFLSLHHTNGKKWGPPGVLKFPSFFALCCRCMISRVRDFHTEDHYVMGVHSWTQQVINNEKLNVGCYIMLQMHDITGA